jgi:hypothetical protein
MVGIAVPPAQESRPVIAPAPAPANEQDVVATYWRRHDQWATLANRLKARIATWRTTSLVLGATGALLQTAAVALGSGIAGTSLSVVGAVALLFVPFIARYFLTPEQVRQWLRARSMSEGLKSLVFRFRAGAAPFAEADRVIRLEDAGKRAESWVEELAGELAGIEDRAGAPPPALAPDAYIERRVRSQIELYYRPGARRTASRARAFRWAELAMAALAAALGGVAAGLRMSPVSDPVSGVGAWVAVLTTIGGAIAAHAAASRYDQQARVYFATARQLEDLVNEWTAHGRPQDPASWSSFVTACEEAISGENRGWMAKLDPEEQRS